MVLNISLGPHLALDAKMECLRLKKLLHTRHNLDLPTYVAVVELVKAFDTVDRALMLHILKKYGAPPNLRSSIARIYQRKKVFSKLGKLRRQ